MMKKQLLLLAAMLLQLIANAHDFVAPNADGKAIFYNYINDGTELEVTFCGFEFYEPTFEYKDNVVIPEEVTYNNMTYRVTNIGSDAFKECTGLTSITIPYSVWNIGNRAFFGCTGLTSVTIGNSVTTIGKSAFQGCTSLTSVIISNSVNTIEESAFQECTSLTSVTIGNGVTTIGEDAFYECSRLQKVIVSDIAAWCGIIFYDNPLANSHHIFSDENTEITDLVIPDGVESIGDDAFAWCYSLNSVTIPNSVKSIGSYAFGFCTGITSVAIPDNVTKIGEFAFEGCSGLYSVTIGNKVTHIGDYAFDYCNNLTSITIPNSVWIIGNCAFQRCTSLTSVTIGANVISIGKNAFVESYLSTIISLIKHPSKINDAFDARTYNNATLYVPEGTKHDYELQIGWGGFRHIVEGTPTAIKNIKQDAAVNASAAIYDINGKLQIAPINSLSHGIYIINRKKVVK